MKKFTYLNIILVAAVVLIGASCKKGFLDRYPQTSIPPDLFFKSEEDLNLYVTGLLTMSDRWSYVGDQDTDDKATTGAVEVKTIMNGTPTSQTITGGWSWGRLRNINYFLDNYTKASVAQDVKDHYAGLARYYRALFYFDKVKRFSDVPWYSTALNPGDSVSLYKPRDPRTLIMDSVMADLEFAASHVKETVPPGTPGKWVMKLAQARVALYEGTFRTYHPELNLKNTVATFLETARKVSDEIILSAKFVIHNTGNPAGDYAASFSSTNLTANKEVILVNIYDQDLKKSGGNNGYIINYEQSPSRDLVQTYLMADGSRFTDKPGYQTMQYVQEFTGRDPRLSQTLMFPGFKMAVNPPNVAVPFISLNKKFSGYHQLKGYINNTESKVTDGVDFPAYRYAEALLIYAEAKAELGNLTQNDLDKSVNLLRARVNMPSLVLATANANVDPVLAAQYPDVTGGNRGVILEIRRERRVEFAMEGYRFDDVIRWHAGKLLEKIPEGMYFPGLGKFDMTGDGIEDMILIDKSTPIPAEIAKEKNSLGVKLVYYKAGSFDEDVTVYLKNGTAGGAIVTEKRARNFIEPKYYYRPVPFNEMLVNPKLAPQLFSWQ